MGLFDDLKKLSKDIGKEIEKSGIKEDVAKFGKEFASGVNDLGKNAAEFLAGTSSEGSTSGSGTVSEKQVSDIPEAYGDFPVFSKPYMKAEEKETDKYKRCTLDFKDATDEDIKEYKDRIMQIGYTKATEVRYEKDNTYIIVDPDGDYGLQIVFHIKK